MMPIKTHKIRKFYFLFPVLFITLVTCGQNPVDITETQVFEEMSTKKPAVKTEEGLDTATFAAGCFWCVQAQFSQLEGVKNIVSGFAGGHTANPTYRQVSTGTTGYAETCNIIYNPSKITYRELLAAFFIAHDPTQLNRQGNDIGTQYRSVIFYHNPGQKKLAQYYIRRLDKVHAYPKKIVTKVTPFTKFYPAKESHQNFYFKNPDQPYCQLVIQPEMERFKKVFHEKIKKH